MEPARIRADGFERAQKISAGRRDFPALIIAKHITAAEDIDGRGAAGEALDPRIPLQAACGEDSDIPFE